MPKYVLNIEKDPEDARDILISTIDPPHVVSDGDDGEEEEEILPEQFSLIGKLQGVRDQGGQGTCAAQSAACVKEYHEKVDHPGFDEHMSPQFIYNNRQNQSGEGMFMRDLMKIMHKVGVVPERLYPYYRIEPRESIDPKLYDEAQRFKIKGYARVRSVRDAKVALMKHGPLAISFPVYNHGETMWKPRGGERLRGGHAMAVVGWTQDGFVIRNSWGRSWNGNGYCTYPYADWGAHYDCWSTIDEKTNDSDDYVSPPRPDPTLVDRIFRCCRCPPPQ